MCTFKTGGLNTVLFTEERNILLWPLGSGLILSMLALYCPAEERIKGGE